LLLFTSAILYNKNTWPVLLWEKVKGTPICRS
jgi:hypothetical protein